MPLLKNRLLPLRTINMRYIARNLELFWKKEWDPELQEVTEASDDILLNLPSVIRLEIVSYYCKDNCWTIKTLLLLLDHRTFSEDKQKQISGPQSKRLDTRYVMSLMARRCKDSTSLVLDTWPIVKDPLFGEVLGTFTKLRTLRLSSTPGTIFKVIGTSLHNLEHLFLYNLENDIFDDIKCLVTGCPKLKILDIEEGATLESVEYLLLGLPNLVEFKHPLMVIALEKIIQDGRAARVSAIRNIYIRMRKLGKFTETDVLKSAQMVMKHHNNITMLDITVQSKPCKKLLTTFALTVSTMSQLTELTWNEYSCTDTIVPTCILEAVGHQLKLLDLRCKIPFSLDVIDQCRKLCVLRITNRNWYMNDPSYDSDLLEQFTPFPRLQELHLIGLNNSHFKLALFKSLIASPVLQDLKLVRIPIFTDNILKAAFSHVNKEGEQLAFTSLRKLMLINCDFITKYLEQIVTHERVPLESLSVQEEVTEKLLLNLEPYDITYMYHIDWLNDV